jgi:hypothetical protein
MPAKSLPKVHVEAFPRFTASISQLALCSSMNLSKSSRRLITSCSRQSRESGGEIGDSHPFSLSWRREVTVTNFARPKLLHVDLPDSM